MKTFKVNDVKLGKGLAKQSNEDQSRNTKSLFGPGVESSSIDQNIHIDTLNNFIATLHTAYAQHYPLVLSPDHIWILIAQGLSKHIDLNAEALRQYFVGHQDKKELTVIRNGFVKGKQNPWDNTFAEFSDKLSEYIGEKRDLIVCNFSTTTPMDKTVSELVLMESMKNYFSYTCMTMCGIPEITLLGTKEDWVNIKQRVKDISQFELEWWTSKLEPLLDEFIAVFDDKINRSFWSSIYKI
jgi:hypothetical protein